jgi:hypothetical protein
VGNKTAYGDTAKRKSETFGFFSQYRSGEVVVEDWECSDQSSTGFTDENVDKFIITFIKTIEVLF